MSDFDGPPEEDVVVPPEVVAPPDEGPLDEHVEPDEVLDDTPPRRQKEREPDSPIERLVPKIDPVERALYSTNRVSGQTTERHYLQGPLMYFPKMELYGILSRAVKIVLEADIGVDIGTIMAMRKPQDVFSMLAQRMPGAEDAPALSPEQGEMDAIKIITAFAEVVSVAPALLKEAYCVVLNIPDGQHREWAMNHALINVDDDTGFDILETFIDQNWDAIRDFFTRHLPRMAQRTVQARERAEARRRSSGTR